MRLSRREALALGAIGAAAAVAGCSVPLPGLGAEDPDDALRRLTATSESELIAAYRAALTAMPSLDGEVAFIVQQHVAHLAALGDPVIGSVAAPSVPTDSRDSALRALRRLESRAADSRTTACTAAGDAGLAETLARVGASESAHASYLAKVV